MRVRARPPVTTASFSLRNTFVKGQPLREDSIRTYDWQQPLFYPHHLLLGASRMRAYTATGPSSVDFFVRVNW